MIITMSSTHTHTICSEHEMKEVGRLLVVGHSAILTFDPRTLQVTGHIDFRGELISDSLSHTHTQLSLLQIQSLPL